MSFQTTWQQVLCNQFITDDSYSNIYSDASPYDAELVSCGLTVVHTRLQWIVEFLSQVDEYLCVNNKCTAKTRFTVIFFRNHLTLPATCWRLVLKPLKMLGVHSFFRSTGQINMNSFRQFQQSELKLLSSTSYNVARYCKYHFLHTFLCQILCIEFKKKSIANSLVQLFLENVFGTIFELPLHCLLQPCTYNVSLSWLTYSFISLVIHSTK